VKPECAVRDDAALSWGRNEHASTPFQPFMAPHDLAPIQANRMIVKALDAGVPDERLAKSLNRPIATIRMSRTMLKDICDEALELLKDKPINDSALRLFRHVKPLRQIEMADLMNKMASCRVSGTHPGERTPAHLQGKAASLEVQPLRFTSRGTLSIPIHV
jgi:hypothetical protein